MRNTRGAAACVYACDDAPERMFDAIFARSSRMTRRYAHLRAEGGVRAACEVRLRAEMRYAACARQSRADLRARRLRRFTRRVAVPLAHAYSGVAT